MAGRLTVCDRDSLIHHYDNTSRKNAWTIDPAKLNQMHLDEKYMFGKYNTTLNYVERKKKRFCIVTLTNNQSMYNNLLKDLEEQDCPFEFEVMALPNFSNEYASAAEALNVGKDLAEADYVILCHHDIRVPRNWLSKINDHIREFAGKSIKFGVLGMAGASAVTEDMDYGVFYLENPDGSGKSAYKYTEKTYGMSKEVQTLDELCLIMKTDLPVRFDEATFNHYHFYGADICLQSLHAGYKNFAINAVCTHLSDGMTNLRNQSHLDLYLAASLSFSNKWMPKFGHFRTTTALYKSKKRTIKYYIAPDLRKTGMRIEETVRV